MMAEKDTKIMNNIFCIFSLKQEIIAIRKRPPAAENSRGYRIDSVKLRNK